MTKSYVCFDSESSRWLQDTRLILVRFLGDSAGFARREDRQFSICCESRRAFWIEVEREYGEVKEVADTSDTIDVETRS